MGAPAASDAGGARRTGCARAGTRAAAGAGTGRGVRRDRPKARRPRAPAVAALATAALWLLTLAGGAAAALEARELAVVVNRNDPDSRALGAAYLEARGIPAANLVEVSLPPQGRSIRRERLVREREALTAQLPERIQALALVWAQPFKVECMSITTAFAAGFDEAWCAEPCGLTRRSDYFDSPSAAPADDHGLRPAMLLAALSQEAGLALIRRGVAADGTRPRGVGYLVETSDGRRNVRAPLFPGLVRRWQGEFELRYLRTEAVEGRNDVMFYFTGATEVPGIASNGYLPGAIADHLTSGGGRLVGGRQMSALRWLEAGVTASYGTVVEPCAYRQKFPHPGVLLRHYLAGDTALEAYWKSVEMPGQGVFIGEPLARPFAARAAAPQG